VTRAQLLALPLGPDAIEARRSRGRLHSVERGVYAVGHRRLSSHGHLLAAVLAGGSGAAASHLAAGRLWGVRRNATTIVDVTVPTNRRSRPRIRFHRTVLPVDELTAHEGIPVTTVPRTLLDLAAILEPRPLERALNEADVLRLTDPLSLLDLLERHPRRPGSAALRLALAARSAGATVTRSELEELFIELLDRHGIRRPELNVLLYVTTPALEVDCLWPDARLVVELDGHGSHGTPAAFERDRERDRLLQAAGYTVIRVTWRHIREAPDRVAADIRRLLEAGARRYRFAQPCPH
jgi:hypothetical protein